MWWRETSVGGWVEEGGGGLAELSVPPSRSWLNVSIQSICSLPVRYDDYSVSTEAEGGAAHHPRRSGSLRATTMTFQAPPDEPLPPFLRTRKSRTAQKSVGFYFYFFPPPPLRLACCWRLFVSLQFDSHSLPPPLTTHPETMHWRIHTFPRPPSLQTRAKPGPCWFFLFADGASGWGGARKRNLRPSTHSWFTRMKITRNGEGTSESPIAHGSPPPRTPRWEMGQSTSKGGK